MAREILGGFGPERSIEGNRARSGGVTSARDVHNYSPPVGPKGIEHRGVGLGGDNHGNTSTQGPHFSESQSEGPGPRGISHGHGTNRKG